MCLVMLNLLRNDTMGCQSAGKCMPKKREPLGAKVAERSRATLLFGEGITRRTLLLRHIMKKYWQKADFMSIIACPHTGHED